MFGMALKLFQMDLSPFSENKQIKEDDGNHIKQSQVLRQLSPNKISRRSYEKENEQQTNFETFQKENDQKIMQELKENQKKVIDDFKKSIIKSQSSHVQEQQVHIVSQPIKQSTRSFPIKNNILSQIDQLSEQYLEYSKQLTVHPAFKNNLNERLHMSYKQSIPFSSKQQDLNRIKSCEMIKQIVKSVLLNGQEQILKVNSTDKLTQKRNLSSLILKSGSDVNIEKKQENLDQQQRKQAPRLFSLPNIPASTDLFKNLFLSLGLVDEQLVDNSNKSLKEIVQIARESYKELKGKNHEQKLKTITEELKIKRLSLSSNNSLKKEEEQVQHEFARKNPYIHDEITNQQIFVKQKRVKVISPQTFSQLDRKRDELEKQLFLAVSFLQQSRLMKKYCISIKKVADVTVSFSLDFKFISYTFLQARCSNLLNLIRNPKQGFNKNTRILFLSNNLVSVTKGLKTKNLIKYSQQEQQKKINKIDQNRFFSLLFKDRSLDFECQNQQIRNEYVKALKIMIKSTNKFQ